MTEAKDHLRYNCEAIAREIENPSVITEDNIDEYDNVEIGDVLTPNSYIGDAFDITYTCNRDRRYQSGCITVAVGGPYIEICTNANNNNVIVKGYWGSDKVTIVCEDNMGVDDYLEELYAMGAQ